ncbi:MAG: DHH family phosphoesterase [Clostridiales bacterium]|nr:DHH family phosphoesterase [Clostridiales bacterium]
MSFKKFRFYTGIPIIFVIDAVVFALMILLKTDYDRMAIVELYVTGVMLLLYIIWIIAARRDFVKIMINISSKLDLTKKKTLDSFPLPVVVTDENGVIEYFNAGFLQILDGIHEIEGKELSDFIEDKTAEELLLSQGINVNYKDKYFSVYSNKSTVKERELYIFYFLEDTELKKTSKEYALSRPSVVLISTDGVEEIQKDYKNSAFSEIRLGIERILGDWAAEFNCLYHKLDADSYIMVIEERNLSEMVATRFRILNTVRDFTYGGKNVGLTLSLGVGTGDNFSECETNARQALDMAQSRGGDQAAVKNRDSTYEFFGGISKGREKSTKVKTRIMASSICELIRNSSNVLIVGHKFPDLDALGSAVGIYSLCTLLGKPAAIVTDKSKSLAQPLIERLESEGLEHAIIHPREAVIKSFRDDTLLIVVDTHIVDFVEEPELLKLASKTVVIDHHRKSVNFIKDAVIFFHDPGASSASEMVTELLEYAEIRDVVGKLEADSLLSGIMLDTRDFVLRAGVRTFEAAAYLKKRGADTVAVKKMFATSFRDYMARNRIVSQAEKFNNCAISIAEPDIQQIRIVSSQAADELLNIEGIDASFVVFKNKNIVNISARSYGKINVQVIMEALGGGGHQTMAAAQISYADVPEAVEILKKEIEKYLAVNKLPK